MWNLMKRKRSARNRRARRRVLLLLVVILAVLLLWPSPVELDSLTSPKAILMEADSGEVLAEKKADDPIYPASMTKMMTALLTLEANPDLDQPVILPEDIFPALQAEGASMAGFRPGEIGYRAGLVIRCAFAFRRGVLRGAGTRGERFGESLCGTNEPEGGRAGNALHPLLQSYRPARPGTCLHRAGYGPAVAGCDAERELSCHPER